MGAFLFRSFSRLPSKKQKDVDFQTATTESCYPMCPIEFECRTDSRLEGDISCEGQVYFLSTTEMCRWRQYYRYEYVYVWCTGGRCKWNAVWLEADYITLLCY